VDDLLVYRLGEKEYMLVVNASNIDKDWNWVTENNTFGAELTNVSDDYALLAVQGPKTVEALQSLTSVNLSEVNYYTFKLGEFAGLDNIILSATGYTGSGGFELYIPNEHAEAVWDAIFEAGADFGIEPIGLGARDTLRLEMGFCLYGNDIDDTTSPLEAGLGWITKLAKGDFNDSELLNQQKAEGTTRRLIGFEMIDRGIPRHDYLIEDAEGNVIGKVTSGTQAPSLDKAIGLGYVNKGFQKSGTEIYIAIRNKKIKAQVVKLPFYKG
jgi:aminomethyltransferase